MGSVVWRADSCDYEDNIGRQLLGCAAFYTIIRTKSARVTANPMELS